MNAFLKNAATGLILFAMVLCLFCGCANHPTTESSGAFTKEPEETFPNGLSELELKFYRMYDISADGKEITVISQSYLENFWEGTNASDVHSVTTEEVLYIIEDSVRLYQTYEKIVMLGYSPSIEDETLREKIPTLEASIINTDLGAQKRDLQADIQNIHDLIMYRIRGLSTPSAFVTAWEAMEFLGQLPGADSTLYSRAKFYFPGYDADTKRNALMKELGRLDNDIPENEWHDVIDYSPRGAYVITLSSGTATIQIFPTVQIIQTLSGEPVENTAAYYLYDTGDTCVLGSNSPNGVDIPGILYQDENGITLSVSGSRESAKGYQYEYRFIYQEGVGYVYSEDQSAPSPALEIPAGTVVQFLK